MYGSEHGTRSYNRWFFPARGGRRAPVQSASGAPRARRSSGPPSQP